MQYFHKSRKIQFRWIKFLRLNFSKLDFLPNNFENLFFPKYFFSNFHLILQNSLKFGFTFQNFVFFKVLKIYYLQKQKKIPQILKFGFFQNFKSFVFWNFSLVDKNFLKSVFFQIFIWFSEISEIILDFCKIIFVSWSFDDFSDVQTNFLKTCHCFL